MKLALFIVLGMSFFIPFYTYFIYPFLLKCISLVIKKDYVSDLSYTPNVSVLIAAYNEEKVIAEKILNLKTLNYPSEKIEFLIGSDGSIDKTVTIAQRFINFSNLRIFDFPRGGKVNALNALIKEAKGEILVFSDANTMYDTEAIRNLVKHFSDPRIGCVSGQMNYWIQENSGEGAKSENLYWKYENWVKQQESYIGRLSGANGAIYAVKRSMIPEIKKGIINDDFYVSTFILQSGFDVILEVEAKAFEEPNNDLKGQFKRHIRDGAGHYQALIIFWRMLFPRKGHFTYFSHRVLKWLVPFCIITAFISNVFLLSYGLFPLITFSFQVLTYLSIVFYYVFAKKRHHKSILSIIAYFFAINLSLFLGLVRLIRKQQKATWDTQR